MSEQPDIVTPPPPPAPPGSNTGTRYLLKVIAGTVLVLFAGIWGFICYQILTPFTIPTDAVPTRVVLSDAVVTTAGFLATTVGTATAAILGITVAQVKTGTGQGDSDQQQAGSLATQAANKVGDDKMLVFAVALYFAVGIMILVTWLIRPESSPELVQTFALSILGWAGGATTSVLKVQ